MPDQVEGGTPHGSTLLENRAALGKMRVNIKACIDVALWAGGWPE
jgi:hypothetical protein